MTSVPSRPGNDGCVGDAGLVHVGARYYDAQVGRFITRDTVLTQKPYLYCEHDPVNALDPTGHNLWTTIKLVVYLGDLIAGGPRPNPAPPHWGTEPVIELVEEEPVAGAGGPEPPLPPDLPPGGGIAAGGAAATLIVGAATGYVGAKIVSGYANRLESFMDPDGKWGIG